VRDESSQIVRLSKRDVAQADRPSCANWILRSALALSALSIGTPSEYELEVTALELPSPLLQGAVHRIGYERQGCSRAVDVILHRRRPAAERDRGRFYEEIEGGERPHGLGTD
jgi:hypothetical protein